ncbi:MAG: PIG-L deacetylase family protein [Caldimonas sp.]
MNNVLVLAAHPDDEVLGCGGTIAKHAIAGDVVSVLILAEGLTSRDETRSRDLAHGDLSDLARAAREANRILGTTVLELHDFPDNRMDSVNLLDIVKVVEAAIAAAQPAIVYTHHAGDVNIDHRRTHEAVVAACRSVPGQVVKQLMYFEVPSSTEWQTPKSAPAFEPTLFVNIANTLETKLEALGCYSSELRPFPHPRSLQAVEALARWRGATAGYLAAEAFMLGRSLVD